MTRPAARDERTARPEGAVREPTRAPRATATPQPASDDAMRAAAASRLRIPGCTYRLQLHRGFGFADARRIVPYLAALGVTDVYASPILAARPGSLHGYDISDHNRLNPELGSEEEFRALTRELAAHGMGLVLDFVPNHMVVDAGANSGWRDVLENGRASPWAHWFDIDWQPLKPELREKVLLPILGDPYGIVLERGELQLRFARGALDLDSSDRTLPIDPREWPRVLRHGLETLQSELPEDAPEWREFLSILTALQNLPPRHQTDPESVATRQREKEVARERLQRLIDGSVRLRQHVDACLRAFNGTPGEPSSFDALHELLENQAYRLAHWRTALHEINYRRFFDVNDLGALRMQEPEVFAATHRLLLERVAARQVTGLRIDHPDGLNDPAAYFQRLQEAIATALPAAEGEQAPPFYVVAEKILTSGESLPERWCIFGTTGYDFLNDLNGIFVDSSHARDLRRGWERFAGPQPAWADVAYESKKLIVQTSMASEMNVLAWALNTLSERDRRSRDFTLLSLRDALREIVACMPVYRTYIDGGCSDSDRQTLEWTIARARKRNRALEPSIFEFVRGVLLHGEAVGLRSVERAARLNVLSELPREWSRQVGAWARLNARHRTVVDDEPAPDRNDEYHFYQTLLGAWPAGQREPDATLVQRLADCMLKAVKEAKLHTSWIHDNEAYDHAVRDFVERALGSRRFLESFLRFQPRIARWGMINSLAQLLLKVAAPGVPDFYRGSELWDLDLVDPDNRRDIDFELRTRMHAELEARAARGEDLLPELLSSWEDGRVKLWLTRIALRFRAAHQALFLEGEYLPLEARGRSEHVCAFARRWHGEWALVVVPRLVSRLPMEQSLPLGAEVWRDSALLLPGGAPLRWTNVLTHQPSFASALENELRLEELLLRFPVALLHATE